MSKLIDLTGKRFGRLTVIERTEDYVSPSGNRFVNWRCKCDCGNETESTSCRLKRGAKKSCGCLNSELCGERMKTHGLSNTKLYKVWLSMVNRCYRENTKAYPNYGGRGIRVCDEWLGENGFINFYNWAIRNGHKEKLTVDRIDNNGNYEPSNCRIVDYKTQANNTRRNVFIEYKGKKQTISQWSEETGISSSAIRRRLKRGWSVKRSLTEPAHKTNKRRDRDE